MVEEHTLLLHRTERNIFLSREKKFRENQRREQDICASGRARPWSPPWSGLVGVVEGGGGQCIPPHRLENPRAAQPLLRILPRTQEKIPDECSMPTYGRSGSIEIVARQIYIEQAPPHLELQALGPSTSICVTHQKTMSILDRNMKYISEYWVVAFYSKRCWLYKGLLSNTSKVWST